MSRYTYKDLVPEEEMLELISSSGPKLHWFAEKGYHPHYYQMLFHCMKNGTTGTRFRHLVAGRRGGKTLSAIWEVVYYCMFPAEFHKDFHGIESDKPLWVWVLAKDYKVGNAALLGIRECLRNVAQYNVDYSENKGNKFIEFNNGTLIEFKTADDPESLRGAGLDILWIDEAAFIPDERAWNVVSPALADKKGIVITTTTPDGKNWFYDEFWSEEALNDPRQGRVEYRSIDNKPGFPEDEWLYFKKRYHPLQFKREFMASFDAMAGKDLSGDWLHYYTKKDLPEKMRIYLGVDPAISLADTADHFVISAIGVAEGSNDVFLLDQYMARIPFAEQVETIGQWHLKWRPELIGIEDNAYQAALVQQVSRLPNFPPVVPMRAKGKKSERILSMSSFFKIGKIRILTSQVDFIDQWVDYDSALKNPKDDCLDSVEIALRTAGVLLPEPMLKDEFDDSRYGGDINTYRIAMLPQNHEIIKGVDEELGEVW